jgi:hypothetical protein
MVFFCVYIFTLYTTNTHTHTHTQHTHARTHTQSQTQTRTQTHTTHTSAHAHTHTDADFLASAACLFFISKYTLRSESTSMLIHSLVQGFVQGLWVRIVSNYVYGVSVA